MNNGKRQPWYGLDDYGEDVLSISGFSEDPRPKINNESQRDQDEALNNPENSIDKDPDQPWVQDNTDSTKPKDAGINKARDYENGDPPIDEWAQPEDPGEDMPHAR